MKSHVSESIWTKVTQQAIERLEFEQQRLGTPETKMLPFTLRTFPEYRPGWFHRVLCSEVDWFLEEVAAKRSPRLIISAPPQHGKSEIISRRTPAMAFGRWPDLRIIGTSYSADRAEDFSRDVQKIIDSEKYHRIFPNTRVVGEFSDPKEAKRTKAEAKLFEIVGHRGRYRAAGVGGGITGEPAEILLVDDPIKDYAEAISETIRESTWNWLTSVAFSRVQEGGGIILMATRWHQDDPIGRLLDRQRGKWRYINFPAIAETSDDQLHFRKIGEELSKERFSLPFLLDIRDGGTVSKYVWSALYQGRPSPLGGGIFKRDDWQFFKQSPDSFDEIIQSWDCAFKETIGSDRVAGGIIGVKGANKYVLDVIAQHLSFRGTKTAIRTLSAKWPEAHTKLIEDKANGPAVIDDLKDEVPGLTAVEPEGGKIVRAHATSGEVEAHNVYLPDPTCVHYDQRITPGWVHDFIEETASFPTGTFDDQVDMLTQALAYLRKRAYGLFELWKREAQRIRPDQPQLPPSAQELADAQKREASGMNEKVRTSTLAKPVINEKTPKCGNPECGNRYLTRRGRLLECNVCGWKQEIDEEPKRPLRK